MGTLQLILLIASLVLAVIAAAGVPAGRINVLAAAAACYVGAQLVGAV